MTTLNLPTPPAWSARAACANSRYPDLWFPPIGGPSTRSRVDEEHLPQVREAVAICEGCDVRAACLQYALENDLRWGIWGATTPGQRKRLRGAA